jgi:alpha-L-rhamnosidase
MTHITYTWKRRKIRYVKLDPTKLTLRDMPTGQWPR